MKIGSQFAALADTGRGPEELLTHTSSCRRFTGRLVVSGETIYGGGVVSWAYGGIEPPVFLSRLREAISIETFEVGILKAPFMALVIGIVACVEGLQVQGSAESLGEQTTNSVVKSIFLVIVLDGMFAMFFASIGM